MDIDHWLLFNTIVCVCASTPWLKPHEYNSEVSMGKTQWGGKRCFSSSASTAITRNWILKNWRFSRDKRWICAFMSSRSVDWKHLCLAGWIPAKVISFSRSLCTLFLLLLLLFLPPCRPSSLLSLLFFFSGFRESHSALLHCLLFILAKGLAPGFCKALTNSPAAFPPLSLNVNPLPRSGLSCMASLLGGWIGKLNYFRNKVTGNQWGTISFTLLQ